VRFFIVQGWSDEALPVWFFLSGLMLAAYHRITTKKIPTIKKQNYQWVLVLTLVQTTAQYYFAPIGVSNTTGEKSTQQFGSVAPLGPNGYS